MNAESIARELRGRKSGGSWVCRCPTHEDRTPSLSVREADGKVLVHCHAGCDQQAVVDALRSRGLWPEVEQTPKQRRDNARQRRKDEADARPARLFGEVAAILTQECLETMDLADPQRRPSTRLLAALRSEAGTLAEYRQWRESQAELTRALVAAGRNRRERLEMLLTNYLVKPEARNAN
jgi:hypothetical protein